MIPLKSDCENPLSWEEFTFIWSFKNTNCNGGVSFGGGFFFLKGQGMARGLSETSALHFLVVLRSFASCFCFPLPFSTRPSDAGILKILIQPPLGAWDGVWFAGVLSGARWCLGAFTVGGESDSLLKCTE